MVLKATRDFTPVRPPRVRSALKPRLSLAALRAFERCHRRERELARNDFVAFAIGTALIGIASFALPIGLAWFSRLMYPAMAKRNTDLLLAMDILLLFATVLIAFFTRKQSRADAAAGLLKNGTQSTGGDDSPLLRIFLILIMLGMLYGEFLVIDAVKSRWMSHRLRHVDRHRAAVILATLTQNPMGIDPRLQLQYGESPLHLRELIAYLVFNEWADVSTDGRTLTLVSPAKRSLRAFDSHGFIGGLDQSD